MKKQESFRSLWGLLAALCLLLSRAAQGQEGGPPAGPVAAPPPMAGMGEFAGAAAGSFEGDLGALSSLGVSVSGDAIIQYDAQTNSIIVITDEATSREITRVIQTLDQPVPQVLIKVLFLEVTHTSDLDFGVEGKFTFQDAAGGEQHTAGTNWGLSSMTNSGFYTIVDEDFEVALRALAGKGTLEVLSRPSVLTRNNATATITIGQELPIITNSRITDNGDTINTVTYDDIGIILEVTPRINAGRLVEMQVSPEISTLSAETVPISNTVNAHVIAKRSAETRVVVADGKTVVIGGLMEDNTTESVKKVPLLGDIPVLGWLFSRTVKDKSKTELLILLSPVVLDTVEALDKLTAEERKSLEMSPKALENPAARKKYLAPLEP